MFLREIRMFVHVIYADYYFEDSFTILKIIVHYIQFEDVGSHYLEKEIHNTTKSQNSQRNKLNVLAIKDG